MANVITGFRIAASLALLFWPVCSFPFFALYLTAGISRAWEVLNLDNMTALVSCFARAYHYKNSEPPVFADSIADQMLCHFISANLTH